MLGPGKARSPNRHNPAARLQITVPSDQATEGMDISAQRDVVLLQRKPGSCSESLAKWELLNYRRR